MKAGRQQRPGDHVTRHLLRMQTARARKARALAVQGAHSHLGSEPREHALHQPIAAICAEVEYFRAFLVQYARQVAAQLALGAEQPRADGVGVQFETLGGLAHVQSLDHAQHEHHAEVFRESIDGRFEQRSRVRRLGEGFGRRRVTAEGVRGRDRLFAHLVERHGVAIAPAGMENLGSTRSDTAVASLFGAVMAATVAMAP